MGYSVRPVIIILFCKLVKPNGKYRIAWILAIYNAAVYFTATFSRFAFYIDENNHFHGGFLYFGKTVFVVSFLLLFYLIYCTVSEYRDTFSERWDKKYPKISQSWRDNWANLSTYFKFPQEVRRLIYTTNTIEGFNRQLRKVTKSKSVFPTDDSLLKMLYLAMMDVTKKWTGRRQDWSVIYAQMAIFFGDRIPE